MKKATYLLLVLVPFLLIGNRSKAQDFAGYKPNYQFAAGLKFGGYENGPSVKYFMNSTTSLEAVLGLRAHGLVVSGLYEINQKVFNVDGFRY